MSRFYPFHGCFISSRSHTPQTIMNLAEELTLQYRQVREQDKDRPWKYQDLADAMRTIAAEDE